MDKKKLIESLTTEINIAKIDFDLLQEKYEGDDTLAFDIESAYDFFEYWYLRGLEIALSRIKCN